VSSQLGMVILANEEEDPLALDWEILACILRRLRRGVQLRIRDASHILGMEALPAFAEVIHGQAMIKDFVLATAFILTVWRSCVPLC
jgi:hypothetical protein